MVRRRESLILVWSQDSELVGLGGQHCAMVEDDDGIGLVRCVVTAMTIVQI